jgi:hypothetical protein
MKLAFDIEFGRQAFGSNFQNQQQRSFNFLLFTFIFPKDCKQQKWTKSYSPPILPTELQTLSLCYFVKIFMELCVTPKQLQYDSLMMHIEQLLTNKSFYFLLLSFYFYLLSSKRVVNKKGGNPAHSSRDKLRFHRNKLYSPAILLALLQSLSLCYFVKNVVVLCDTPKQLQYDSLMMHIEQLLTNKSFYF